MECAITLISMFKRRDKQYASNDRSMDGTSDYQPLRSSTENRHAMFHSGPSSCIYAFLEIRNSVSIRNLAGSALH